MYSKNKTPMGRLPPTPSRKARKPSALFRYWVPLQVERASNSKNQTPRGRPQHAKQCAKGSAELGKIDSKHIKGFHRGMD